MSIYLSSIATTPSSDVYDLVDLVTKSKHWNEYFKQAYHLTPKTQRRLQRSHKSYRYFLENITVKKYKLAPFQDPIIESLEDFKIKDKLFVVPREHGKSTICCEEFLAWYGSNHPYHYALIFSDTRDQAHKRGKQIKNIIETTPELSSLRQKTKEDWGTLDFTFKNGFHVEMYGSGSGVAGLKYLDRRPDIIILDDVVPTTPGSVSDIALRNWYEETIGSLGGPDTIFIIIGTPYRSSDLLAKLSANDTLFKIRYEALLGKDIEYLYKDDTPVLWPAHWPLSRLKTHLENKLQHNKLVFARQFLCRIVSEGTRLYPETMIEYCKDPTLDFVFSRRTSPYRYKAIVIGNDLARSAEVGADFWVIYVIGITENNRFHQLWLERHKGLRLDQQKALTLHMVERYAANLTVIEGNGYQTVFADDVSLSSRHAILVFTTTAGNKHNELTGLPAVKSHLGNRRMAYPTKESKYTQSTFEDVRNEQGDVSVMVIPEGGALISDNQKALFDEMSGWQWDKEKGKWITVNEHDDTVMAQWFATHAAEKHGEYSFEYAGSMPSPTQLHEEAVEEILNSFGKQDEPETDTGTEEDQDVDDNSVEFLFNQEEKKKEKEKENSLFDQYLPDD